MPGREPACCSHAQGSERAVPPETVRAGARQRGNPGRPASIGDSPRRQETVIRPATGTHRLTRRGLLGLAAAPTLVACTGDPTPSQSPATGTPTPSRAAATAYTGPEVDISFWTGFTGGDGPTMRELVRQFGVEHPNITVNYRATEWDTLYADLNLRIVAGTGPDVAVLHHDRVPTLAARKLLQSLEPVVDALNYGADDFAPVAWAAGIYREVRYALPLDVHPLGVFQNTDLVARVGGDPAKPPRDSNELIAVLDALKAQNIHGMLVSPERLPGGVTCESLLWQFGGAPLTQDEFDIDFAGEAGLKALTWYSDLVSNGWSTPGRAGEADRRAFLESQVAYRWDGGWQINAFNEEAAGSTPGGQPALHWSMAPVPNIGGTAAVWAGSHQFVLPNKTPVEDNRLAAAQTLIAWLSSHGLDWARSGQVPALNSVRSSPEFAALIPQATLASQLSSVRLVPAVAGIEDVMAFWLQSVTEVATGKSDPRTALNKVAAPARAALELNRRKYG